MKKLIILLAAGISFTSCYRNGYGCKGNSRIMTRVAKVARPVEYFKNGQVLLPDYACPDTLIVRDAVGLNAAMGLIEQGLSGQDFGDAQFDSLFHEYTDYWEGSFEQQFESLRRLEPTWDSLQIVQAINED